MCLQHLRRAQRAGKFQVLHPFLKGTFFLKGHFSNYFSCTSARDRLIKEKDFSERSNKMNSSEMGCTYRSPELIINTLKTIVNRTVHNGPHVLYGLGSGPFKVTNDISQCVSCAFGRYLELPSLPLHSRWWWPRL